MQIIMEMCTELMQIEPIEVLFKLVLAYILSGSIGLERAALSKPAGFRTHVLVAMSAVLTVICGEKIAEVSGASDFSRIPAQLLSGIGFLGAGTILRDGFNVKGLTTAASLLAVTCIGLCIGAGLYLTGIIATAVVYVVLAHSHRVSDKVEHYREFSLKIEAHEPKEIIEKIHKILDRYKLEVQEMAIEKDEDMEYIKIFGKHRDEINKNKLLTEIMEIDPVSNVMEI